MSTFKRTFTSEIVLHTDNGRDFRVIRGEIYEVVRGAGFVAETKVVVREDVAFVVRQVTLAVEI